MGEPQRIEHEGKAEEQSRHDPRQKEGGDGDIGEDPVDDEGDAGRDDRPHAGCRRGQGGGDLLVVSGGSHGGQEQGADGDRRGHRGTGDGGEHGAGQDHGQAQAAPDMTQKETGKTDQIGGYAPFLHQVPGEDEQGDGQEGKRGEARKGGLNDDRRREAVLEEDICQGSPAEHQGDGNSHRQERRKSDKKQGQHFFMGARRRSLFPLSHRRAVHASPLSSFSRVMRDIRAKPAGRAA